MWVRRNDQNRQSSRREKRADGNLDEPPLLVAQRSGEGIWRILPIPEDRRNLDDLRGLKSGGESGRGGRLRESGGSGFFTNQEDEDLPLESGGSGLFTNLEEEDLPLESGRTGIWRIGEE